MAPGIGPVCRYGRIVQLRAGLALSERATRYFGERAEQFAAGDSSNRFGGGRLLLSRSNRADPYWEGGAMERGG